jgi:hypothetical protein
VPIAAERTAPAGVVVGKEGTDTEGIAGHRDRRYPR